MPGGKNILVIHGPNLNLLGLREPDLYGHDTLEVLDRKIQDLARSLGIEVEAFQSNSEGEIVGLIHQCVGHADALVINPAAYTHTSVALRDALSAVGIPFVEVHLSNVFARESFRRESYFTDIAVGIISGLGARGYELALEFALRYSGKRG